MELFFQGSFLNSPKRHHKKKTKNLTNKRISAIFTSCNFDVSTHTTANCSWWLSLYQNTVLEADLDLSPSSWAFQKEGLSFWYVCRGRRQGVFMLDLAPSTKHVKLMIQLTVLTSASCLPASSIVGGWTAHPFEQYWSNWIISTETGVGKKTCLKPPPVVTAAQQ